VTPITVRGVGLCSNLCVVSFLCLPEEQFHGRNAAPSEGRQVFCSSDLNRENNPRGSKPPAEEERHV
jgi:hypothetical protein